MKFLYRYTTIKAVENQLTAANIENIFHFCKRKKTPKSANNKLDLAY